MNTITKYIVAWCCSVCLCSATAYSGDDLIAREYAKKSDFRAVVTKFIKTSGPRTDMFLKSFDMNAVEGAYVRGLAQHLSNNELAALSQALDIPGYRDAMKKLPRVTSEMMEVVLRESRAAAEKAGVVVPQGGTQQQQQQRNESR